MLIYYGVSYDNGKQMDRMKNMMNVGVKTS